MITIDQLLESVDLTFEPRWVTKDPNGTIAVWDKEPCADEFEWFSKEQNYKVETISKLKLSEFEGRDWTECIYEVPRKTTGKIEKLDIIKDTRNVIDKDGIVHTVANFTTVEKINALIDAVNELKENKGV